MSSSGSHDIQIKFWGARGSIPTPGKQFNKYGGNTSCVEVRCGETLLVIDAGTGIKNLGQSLVKEFGNSPVELHLLISHTHWDHIQGFPFFSLIFMKDKHIHIYGGHFYSEIKTLLAGQMQKEYFPVSLDELAAKLDFIDLEDLDENVFFINDIKIEFTYLMHPTLSFGFRIEYKGKIFVYATDNELIDNKNIPGFNKRNISNLVENADILIADCQYTEEEYPSRIGWGHSTVERVVALSKETGVKRLYMYHHDPYHDDKQIDRMVKDAKKKAGKSLKVYGAREEMTVFL
ncbi:MAG: MBL fold metallo-hydrolase [bacterium]|nr:MBL fold metallo-hydrolase [bacterium]